MCSQIFFFNRFSGPWLWILWQQDLLCWLGLLLFHECWMQCPKLFTRCPDFSTRGPRIWWSGHRFVEGIVWSLRCWDQWGLWGLSLQRRLSHLQASKGWDSGRFVQGGFGFLQEALQNLLLAMYFPWICSWWCLDDSGPELQSKSHHKGLAFRSKH